MEPLGTITMYYQFLDNEIVNILDRIMQEAEDYRDFTEQLVDYVSTKDVPTIIGFIAAIHVWNIGQGSQELGRKLRPKFGEYAHIFPWIGYREKEEWWYSGNWALFAFAENHEDWIKAMLCYARSYAVDRWDIQDINKFNAQGIELLDINQKLECFRSYLLETRGLVRLQEGSLEDALVDLEEGLRIARKYDDRHQASYLLFNLGKLKMNADVNESWEYFDEAFRIADSIGQIQGAAFAISRMGGVAHVRGEYDLALESYLRSKELCTEAEVWAEFEALNLARIYYSMRDGRQALLWAISASEELRFRGGQYLTTIERARALILLGRLNKASAEIDSANELVLKDGREDHLGLYKYVSGLLDCAEGRILEGISNLEEAFNIFDQNSNEVLAVPCLVDLARAEVTKYDVGGDLDTSGSWLLRLEQRARERDYPGILMEHALLKAEFQMKQGVPEVAKKTLTDALNIYDSPSVKTLRTMIEERIQSLTFDA